MNGYSHIRSRMQIIVTDETQFKYDIWMKRNNIAPGLCLHVFLRISVAQFEDIDIAAVACHSII